MDTLPIAITLALSTNLDNFAVGVAYSTKSRSISLSGNLIIALLSGLSTWASMFLGDWLYQYLPTFIAHWFGSVLLISLGCWSLWEQLQHYVQVQPQTQFASPTLNTALTPPETLSLQDSFFLGCGLTISNLGTGIGAGMTHISIGLVSSLSVITSVIMIGGGTMLGKAVLQAGSDNRLMGWFTGVGLIVLGAYEAIA